MLLWNVIEEMVKNLLYCTAADLYCTLCLLMKTKLQTMLSVPQHCYSRSRSFPSKFRDLSLWIPTMPLKNYTACNIFVLFRSSWPIRGTRLGQWQRWRENKGDRTEWAACGLGLGFWQHDCLTATELYIRPGIALGLNSLVTHRCALCKPKHYFPLWLKTSNFYFRLFGMNRWLPHG